MIASAPAAAIRLLILGSLSVLVSAATPPRTNRLAQEKSPYLLQHAADPVDWHPWGPEAFALAARENKPVFLSIGFSTCLWCHVMQRESFANPEIAALLNKYFVAVLIDREERPDIDRVYMSAADAAGWGGGWPLNLWLTPDKKPFFGGTYFPPEASGERPGLRPLLERVTELWRTRRGDALRDAEDVGRALEASLRVEKSDHAPGAAVLDGGFAAYRLAFDPEHGGFGPPPKFPNPSGLSFLLRYSLRTRNKTALDMVVRTLRAMAVGEIHDRIGGGFHRYAAGAAWNAPHHEKMLSDNAQLASVYLDAYQATKDPKLARVARETLDYMARDLLRPGGGFYTAEDADAGYYSLPTVEERAKHARPSKDDKILSGYNGLALSALAKGGRILDEPRYLEAAKDTARFLRENLYDATAGRLYRRWRDGDRKVPGFAEDYALMIAGLLDLHEAAGDPGTLAWATRLADAQQELFYDEKEGGYYAAASGADESLIVRPLEDTDGALPSAAAVATMNNLRLFALTGRKDFARAAEKTLKRFGVRLARAPRDYPAMLSALDLKLAKSK
jgi:hypothetical protein